MKRRYVSDVSDIRAVARVSKGVKIGGPRRQAQSVSELLDEVGPEALARQRAEEEAAQRAAAEAAQLEKEKAETERRIKELQEKVEAQERAKANLIKSFTCPLTHAFFVDPVMLADGYTYERRAAEKFLASEHSHQSPMTQEPLLNTRSVSNIAMRHAITYAVASGAVTGELVDEYQEAIEQIKRDARKVAQLKEGVARSDADSITQFAAANLHGWYGLKVDASKAFRFSQQAAHLGHVSGMALYGYLLVYGKGCTQRRELGMTYIGMAAGQGSESACGMLGRFYSEGDCGYPQDSALARDWFRKMADANHQDADTNARTLRDRLLAQAGGSDTERDDNDDDDDDDDENQRIIDLVGV